MNPWLLVGVGLALPIANATGAQAPAPARVGVPMDCAEHFCVIQKNVAEALIRAHNAVIDERNALRAEIAARGRACPGDRGA